MSRFPNITVDLSKCDDTWDVEGKVHGQMKQHFLEKSIRREFTREVQSCKSWYDVIETTRRWVKVAVEIA